MADESITRLFISYARADGPFVHRLEAELRARGFTTWVDRTELKGGQDWLNKIQEAIENSQAMMVVLSPESVASRYVRVEYRHAIREGKVMIPIKYREPGKVPIDLNDIQWVSFETDFEAGLKDLLTAIVSAPPMSSSPPAPRTPIGSDTDEPDLVVARPAPAPPTLIWSICSPRVSKPKRRVTWNAQRSSGDRSWTVTPPSRTI